MADEEWSAFSDAVLLPHPLRALLHEDPFTRRAFMKPRGYPGDAVLLDYIYQGEDPAWRPPGASTAGCAVFSYTGQAPAPQAVRNRRRMVAQAIDSTASERTGARVLAIAAGHLREAEVSEAFRARDLREVVAIDQDPASLARLEADYGASCVKAIQGTVRQLLRGQIPLGEFDLVYAAGLFDYLADPVARALLSNMIGLARPGGGRVLIANFLPQIADRGYMESYMAWRLTYRSQREMAMLLPSVRSEFTEVEFLEEDAKNILFLSLRRA
jgi:hypothetical protein